MSSHLRFFTFPDFCRKSIPLVEDLQRAGITAWTSGEYERALFALIGEQSDNHVLSFSVACVENDGNARKIQEVAAKYTPYANGGSTRCGEADGVYIEALLQLGRIRGMRRVEGFTLTRLPKWKDCKELSLLLGIRGLYNLRGWIERQTSEYVWVFIYLPPKVRCPKFGMVRIPICSCPALQKACFSEKGQPLPVECDSQLRPYQSEQKANIMKAWQGARRVMLQMPTGTGKTRLFVSLIRDILHQQPEARVLIVAHRTELIDQISHSLTCHYKLNHGILGRRKTPEDQSILVASIQMLSCRVGRDERLATFDYIIIDEAHHSLAPTYKKLIEAYPRAKVLGVTATPYRLKKASFAELYDTLVESQPMRQFIADGYLASYRLFTVSDRMAAMGKINRLTRFGSDGDYKAQDLNDIFDTEAEIRQLYDCYEMYAAGKKGIVYAVSRDHAAHIATLFNNSGVKAAAIDCDTPKEERQRFIGEFKASDGSLKVLVNVELFTEGFDCPSIEFVMLARPTRSLTLYLQQVGRALRPTPSGNEVVILDYAGLYNRFGLPERNRDWQSHFNGVKPKNEDYTKRPLGTLSVNGLMMEVGCNRKKIVTGYQFRNIVEVEEGIFSAERIYYGYAETYTLRFDRNLHLLPSSVIRVGTKGSVYVHGDLSTEPFYTMSLALDTPLYRKCTTQNHGIAMLKGIHCSDCIVVDDKVSSIRSTTTANGNTYTVTSEDWWVSSGGTVFWPVLKGFLLRYTKYDKGITLYDAHFTPLLHGNSIELHEDRCVIERTSQPPLTIDYIDYLRNGIEQ